MSSPPLTDSTAETAEIVDLANELVGRIWGHFTARASELNLTVAEVKGEDGLR